MAKRMDSWSDHEVPIERPPRRGSGWLGWLLFLLVCGAAGAFVWYLYLPLRAQRNALEQRIEDRERHVEKSAKQLERSAARVNELERRQEQLSGQLQQTQAEKASIEAELKRVQGELSAKLEPEIKAGNVTIRRRGNDLVVDLADKILFESAQTELHESGQKVLTQVAPTLAALND